MSVVPVDGWRAILATFRLYIFKEFRTSPLDEVAFLRMFAMSDSAIEERPPLTAESSKRRSVTRAGTFVVVKVAIVAASGLVLLTWLLSTLSSRPPDAGSCCGVVGWPL